MFSIGKVKHKLLKSIRILKSVTDSFIYALYMKIAFEVLEMFHKEIKQIITICPGYGTTR